jgi:hypothetical protein
MSKHKAAPWGNRIVGEGTMAAGQFLANPSNWRTHGIEQDAQLSSILNDVGFVAPVIVNKRTNAEWGKDRNIETLVDGHLRVKAALSRGDDTPVPYIYVDLSPEEERRVLLTFDPIGAMAGKDDELMKSLMTEVAVEWPGSELDIDAVLKLPGERKKAKGLTHEVKECLCCKEECQPGCGCHRDDD